MPAALSTLRYLCEEDQANLLLAAALLVRKKKKKRTHRYWVSPLCQKRLQYGAYYTLVRDLESSPEQFKAYFRLTKEQFAVVLKYVEEPLEKQYLTREPISPRQRLAVTLRYVYIY